MTWYFRSLATLVALLGVPGLRGAVTGATATSLVGRPAPAFTRTTIDAKIVRLADFRIVIDPSGIVRAIHADTLLPRGQLQVAAIPLGARPRTAITIAPWTGPELPGSVASTYKYRVALSGPPGKTVTLRASGLPRRWVASFCTDRVCAPFRVQILIPPSGVKVIEFQVIPDGPNSRAHPKVRIDATAGRATSATSVVISPRASRARGPRCRPTSAWRR